MRHYHSFILALVIGPAGVTIAEARLFWQTYGATVPADGGCGCSWNVNQDYFVPRTCANGQYGLFSGCKCSHYLSPACKYLSPIYTGYCTPYSSCHYRRKDCVYKERCGCTPLKCEYGPWHLQKCRKHCLVLANEGCSCRGGYPSAAACPHCEPTGQYGDVMCHVEPIGETRLGNIAALPAASAGGGMGMMNMMNGSAGLGAGMNAGALLNFGGAMSAPMMAPSAPTAPAATPNIPKIPTPPSSGAGYSLPAVF